MPADINKNSWMKDYGPYMVGGLGSAFGSMMMENPYESAMPYIQSIPETIRPYYEPYFNAGIGALGKAGTEYDYLTKSPTQMLSSFGSQYQQSPGYQWQVDQATKAANQAAASRGMAGSPAEQAELSKYITGLASQDYNDYLNQVLGLYGRGLSGYERMYGTGAQMGSDLATSLANVLATQAGLAQRQTESENRNKRGFLGGLGLLSLIPFI